ncbi:MAG TPA: DUF6285 domain-containing protein [Burkholderiaceae bacterium]|nr:DUF6285 domain-containing protein [Burkholderiaceae bacterium]HSB99715.1 DUF6285 domain-containing protein [Burkholderiaceae bacterium]
MFDRPSPDELLDAVAAFLREQVAAGGSVAYHARVAANALDIVRRELTLGPAARQRAQVALARLLGADPRSDPATMNRQLCERIASGAFDLATPGLVECLWQITLDKLAVDQPGYETYVRCIARDAADDPRR